jgi:hypothetical protein
VASAGSARVPDAGAITVGQLLDRGVPILEAATASTRKEEQERMLRLHLKPTVGAVKLE